MDRLDSSAPPTPPARNKRLRAWALALLIGGVSALATYLIGEYFLEPRLPALLVGKWTVVEGDGKGATIEFFRDGTMRRSVPIRDGLDVLEGQAVVEDNQLFLTVKLPPPGGKTTSRQVILDLTEDQLVTGDQAGNVTILKRLP